MSKSLHGTGMNNTSITINPREVINIEHVYPTFVVTTSWLIQLLLCVSVKNLNNWDSWRHPRKKHICIEINDNCATVRTNPIHHQVEAAFSRFDISGDEQLDYKEFCNMMNARQRYIFHLDKVRNNIIIISKIRIFKHFKFFYNFAFQGQE